MGAAVQVIMPSNALAEIDPSSDVCRQLWQVYNPDRYDMYAAGELSLVKTLLGG